MQNLCKNIQKNLVLVKKVKQSGSDERAGEVKYEVVNVKRSAHKEKLRKLDKYRKPRAREEGLNKFPPCGVCYRRKEGGRDHKSDVAEDVCEYCREGKREEE